MTYRLTIRNRHIDTILNEITTKIPDSETSIDLSTSYEIEGNDFFFVNTITAENYIKILREFPKLIKSVDMSQNELSRFNGDLVTVTQALPENLSSLTWHNNDLAKLPADVLVNVFKALPRKLTSFNLGENDLDTLPADVFARAMQALPEGLETLNLTANLLRYSADEIVTIFKSLPLGLKSLNLSLCNFYRFTVYEWIKIMGALPKNLRELGLIFNMVPVNPVDWPGIMKSMPKNLRSIDLRHNGFDKLPADDQATIFK